VSFRVLWSVEAAGLFQCVVCVFLVLPLFFPLFESLPLTRMGFVAPREGQLFVMFSSPEGAHCFEQLLVAGSPTMSEAPLPFVFFLLMAVLLLFPPFISIDLFSADFFSTRFCNPLSSFNGGQVRRLTFSIFSILFSCNSCYGNFCLT